MDSSRRAELFFKQGWCPVPWAHHPQPIKDAIREMRFRPQIKQCWANCQRLFLGNLSYNLGLELELWEGWATPMIPIAHCWLKFEGEILDLTLPPRDTPVEYGPAYRVEAEDLIRSIVVTDTFAPVDRRRLYEISPWREPFERLQEFMDEQRLGEVSKVPQDEDLQAED